MYPSYIIALTALVSMISSGVGVYVGMKVGLAKLETWRDIADKDIRNIQSDVSVLLDDSLIYDGEIDVVYDNLNLHRAVRPRERMRR